MENLELITPNEIVYGQNMFYNSLRDHESDGQRHSFLPYGRRKIPSMCVPANKLDNYSTLWMRVAKMKGRRSELVTKPDQARDSIFDPCKARIDYIEDAK
jgi:hypothetical protein